MTTDNPRQQFRELMVDYFSLKDIRNLCFDFVINYEQLEGESIDMKIVSLINYMEKHGKWAKLHQVVTSKYAHVPWPTLEAFLAATKLPQLPPDNPAPPTKPTPSPVQPSQRTEPKEPVRQKPIAQPSIQPRASQPIRQTIPETIPLLSPLNPLDYLRLLGWLFFAPQTLKAYENEHGQKAVYPVGNWLASTLTWLPLFMLMLGLALGRIPTTDLAWSTITYGWLCGGLFLAWALTGGLAGEEREGVVFGVAAVMADGVVAFGVVMFVMVAVVAGGVAFGVAAGVAAVVAGGVAFVVAFGVAAVVAFVVAFMVAVGVAAGVVAVVAAGVAAEVAGLVAVGVAAGVAAGVAVAGVAVRVRDGVENGRPNPITVSAGIALIASYAFLIWFCFLGGAAALGA